MKSGTTFILMVIAAFLSVISFFQIDSAAADKHSANWFFLTAGIAGVIATGVFLFLTIKKTKK